MGKALQPVSIDGIEFDALIGSNEQLDAQVPEYSVETGFSVSDTIILNPELLDLTLFVSNRPVTWAKRFGASNDRVDQVVKQLKELYMSRKLITVTTGSETYTSMAITSLTISKSNTLGYAREIPVKLKKVRVTQVKTTTIPASYGKSGTTGASAGTASTVKANGGSSKDAKSSGGNSSEKNDKTGKSGSILYGIASSVGLLK